MSPRRLAIVTRYFWPVIEPSGVRLSELAEVLRHSEVGVKIFTSRWESEWASRLEFREVEVIRVNRPAPGAWRLTRYARVLAKELLQQAPLWDAALVAGGSEEIEGALVARDRGGPRQVWIRADDRLYRDLNGGGSSSKLAGLLARVDEVICPWEPLSRLFERRLRRPIQVLPDGILSPELEQAESRERKVALREAISDLHPLLQIGRHVPLGVVLGGFEPAGAIDAVIEAWQLLAVRRVRPRLWLVGDGEGAMAVWQKIHHLGLAAEISLPGNFDNLNDPLLAADFFLHPWPGPANAWGVEQAMICGMPIVFARGSDVPTGLSDRQTGLAYNAESPADLARTIERIIDDEPARTALGREASRIAQSRHAMDRAVAAWLPRLSEIDSRPGVAP